ncbi:CaiB/BaiF CoA transferase family protein [Bordetella hinzii]|uniref:CoA transferase n=1 Tax=Bordetella hinzii TaxID=103855 RepID=A0AAN1RSJ9_9BORD|nr:CaiB/BaiF CoA-transferase family protein [Bordetella hinzii]KCB30530.1 CoA-transferase family III protein [Bordetella hinzii L60]KCB41149.1 CoA-transferase family III protein [Bordetella hinzii 4161]AKQ54940.1 Succinyl-CoA:(R)-benzylsuccinate CoA-transferase subunit BbsF [Bordetella hinzii]AZW15317.1 CoA transferase [Bordetella hinzii]KXA72613.1 CoA-transferase [Bordetella hinzii LMG 13501]
MKDEAAMTACALQHVKVLDLSRVLAGPWAAQTLGDLGAEVIKVERPGTGDDTRAWGPPYVTDPAGQATGESAYYMCANRNKLSVTIDFTQPEGQALLRQLAAQCDVLIENFKTGGLAQYGLDYASLSALNPRLVYCSVTGFGQDGPYAHRAGYDFLIQGMGGLMSITGQPDGAPGAGPMKVGVALTDILTGLYASTAILAALQAREHTGRGQHIDLALLDVGVACLGNQAMNYLYSGTAPRRMGNGHPNTAPYQDFPTADGHMILAVGNDGQFARLCVAIGRPEWATDPRFAANAARLANRKELIDGLLAITVTRSTREWIGLLEQHGVPCGPINNVAEVFEDPQVQARGMRIAMTHPRAGEVPLVASPIRLSDTPVSYRHAPPQLGQHTDAVLAAYLGLSAEALRNYRSHGVLG